MSEEKKMEDIFELIHRKQAERLLELLEGDAPLTAQEFNAISKFLSDNNVTGVKETNPGLQRLDAGFTAFEASTFTPPTRN